MSKKDIQFNLRVPEELKNKIDEASKFNQRSINAEATSRLYDSFVMNDNIQVEAAKVVESFLRSRSPTERKKNVAERLNFLLNELKKIRCFSEFTIAELAFEIGESAADEAEAWFRAELEPTFGQLEKIAAHASADPSWLLFGKGRPFEIKHMRLKEYLEQDIRHLLSVNTSSNYLSKSKVRELKFIRELSEEGRLLIAKVYENEAVETFYTSYHVSEVNGVGGYNSLLYVCLMCKILLKTYSNTAQVTSHLLEEVPFNLILEGKAHPLRVLQSLPHIPWADDLADKLPDRKLEYWNGFDNLRARILKSFQEKEYIRTILDDPEFCLKHPIKI